MKKLIVVASLMAVVSSCGKNDVQSSDVQAAAAKVALVCNGFERLENGIAVRQVKFNVGSRLRFDEKAGIPVPVELLQRVVTPMDKNVKWAKQFGGEGRKFQTESTIKIEFENGSLDVALGNSGITGQRHAYDGEILFHGKSTRVSCPIVD